MVKEKTIFTFVGAPGSGKGTIAERCVKELSFKMLSTGNLCRQAIAAQTEEGKLIQQYTSEGKLVPDEVIANMVEQWLDKEAKDSQALILDGYPRTQKQAELLLDLLKKKFADTRFRVVEIEISDDAIIKRISNRLMCENKKCQAVYSRTLLKDPNNLTCPACKSKLIRRADDREEVVRKRLSVYAKTSTPLLDFYKSSGLTIEKLPVEGLTVDKVFEKFKGIL